MRMFRVLVNSLDTAIGDFLKGRLSPSRFEVVPVQPGLGFIDAACRERPEIAVLDCVHERLDAVPMEVAVLKEIRPKVRIIVLSGKSSTKDASVVEQGIFYYMTVPVGPALIQVIEGAAQAIARENRFSYVGCGV